MLLRMKIAAITQRRVVCSGKWHSTLLKCRETVLSAGIRFLNFKNFSIVIRECLSCGKLPPVPTLKNTKSLLL